MSHVFTEITTQRRTEFTEEELIRKLGLRPTKISQVTRFTRQGQTFVRVTQETIATKEGETA